MEVSLYKPLAEFGKLKKFNAILLGYDENNQEVELEYKSKNLKLNIKDIAVIREAIHF